MQFSKRFFAVALIAVACCWAPAGQAEDTEAGLKSQNDQPQVCHNPGNAFEVLYIGNSITKHGVDAMTIQNLGWGHVSGMAASSPETDYVAKLDKKLQTVVNRPVIACYHNYGGSGKIAQRLSAMSEVAYLRPDLVVIQLGEHETIGGDLQTVADDYRKLLRAAKALSGSPKVIAIGTWCPIECAKPRKKKLWVVEMDEVMAKVAAEEGVPFSSIFDIGGRPDASGTGTSEGLRWHPNDVGHALYADRLFSLYMSLVTAKK